MTDRVVDLARYLADRQRAAERKEREAKLRPPRRPTLAELMDSDWPPFNGDAA